MFFHKKSRIQRLFLIAEASREVTASFLQAFARQQVQPEQRQAHLQQERRQAQQERQRRQRRVQLQELQQRQEQGQRLLLFCHKR